MAKRMNPRKKENEYLVKWEFKPQTWEPASHLDTCKDLIENFEVLLAKQKEMRLKSQQQTPQSQQAQPQATSTPTIAPATPNRPVRHSKEKAINQVKQWTGGSKHQDESSEPASGKRKLEEEDEYEEEMDGDDVDDADYELESSWERKKMAQQLGQTSVKRIKTDILGHNGNTRIINKSGSDMTIGATVVRKVIGTKSPDVIMAGQKQQSGVFKRASPAVVQKKPGEGQVRIVGSKDQVQSGIVRVGGAAKPTQVVTRVVPKASPAQQVRGSPGTGTVVRTVQSVQNQQKTLAQKIIQRSPINKAQSPVTRPSVGQIVQRQSARTPANAAARKPVTPQPVTRRGGQATPVGRAAKSGTTNHDEDDDGIPDPFPKDLPPIETESSSPPPPLTLCPITGKVLGQAEGEAAAAQEQEAEGENADQHQITQLLSNEDGTPIYITGDDGTMYQVAGKNANGETILISTNAEGEQTCVLLPADQDLLAGLPGIQTTDATEASVEGAPMSVDAAVAEAVSAASEQAEGEQQFFAKEGDETSQSGGEEVTQPLSIAVGGESGDSQDGQITAEIVQADEPSPGETRKELNLELDD
jgi:Chromo (CHRromatin Organisation MOdifier) domain